jgi:hypothetical protein
MYPLSVGAPHGRELFRYRNKKQQLAPMGRSYDHYFVDDNQGRTNEHSSGI